MRPIPEFLAAGGWTSSNLFRRAGWLAVVLALGLSTGCGDDDLSEMPITGFDIVVSEPRFVIPSDALPEQAQALSSNNNVDIELFEDRLFLAWRTAPNHFASPDVLMHIVSSTDQGVTWEYEHTIQVGADMREPRFLVFDGGLQLMFFEGGTNPGAFEPQRLWRTRRSGLADWQPLEIVSDTGEVPWDVKVHDGVAYRTSYQGEHYGAGDVSEIAVFFKESTDGTHWTAVDGREFAYFGGVSEAAFEFAADGSMWIVTRNEDGDQSGFGSHLCFAPAAALADWECPSQTDPERYDSPEMFRHEDDIYLVARRDVGGPYDRRDDNLTLAQRRARYLIDYSLRPKRTALYRIDREARSVVHVMDLPGAGDTAFPSVRQNGPHTFLLANYTSPLDDPDITWLSGQTSDRGTQIYLLQIEFVPFTGPTRTSTPTASPTPLPTLGPDEGGPDVEVDPVFAEPGVLLSIEWPDVEDLVGLIDLGDATVIDPSVTEHEYPNEEAIYDIRGSFRTGSVTTQLDGVVARVATRGETPLDGFTLIEPSEDVVEQVIRGIMPAFYYAYSGERLAIAADATGTEAFGFDEVASTEVSLGENGAFSAAPVDLVIELRGAGGRPSGLDVGIRRASLHGEIDGSAIASPVFLTGAIVLDDIVRVAQELAGFEREAAVEFLAGLFAFDPASPPADLPFQAELAVESGIES